MSENPRKPRRRNSTELYENNFGTETKTVAEKNIMKPIKLIISGVVLVVLLVLSLICVKIVTIDGNELGVKETWNDGVITNIMQPKTYFLFPGWSQTVYKYDASSQVFVMNDKAMNEEGKNTVGRSKDSYLVQSQEGQDMRISLNLRWRLDPSKLISIHKTVRENVEEKIIRPVVMRVVKDKATKMKAIDAYSGEGLVRLQAEIQDALSGKDKNETDELAERGVTVENFVIEHIELDPLYIAEIKGKQIATQKTLRSKEEQIAAEAAALVAKSTAQAEYNTKLVAQQLLATNMVLQAEAENQKIVIAAKADAAKQMAMAEASSKTQILEAEGKKGAMIATAEGTLAMGKAEATAKELMLKAYSVPGSENWVRVEVAKSLAEGIQNIKGYLPADMKVNLLTDNYLKGVDTLTGNPIAGPAPAPAK
jgi:regulator of protease activity HflC (stomatin/prohibitin superfamily)